MKTMTLVHTTEKRDDLLTMTDTDLETWFSEVGLPVQAVAHCSSAGCSVCFPGHDEHAIRSDSVAA